MLIPCGIGGQDAPLALADLAQLPDAWLIVNRWPMVPKHPRRPKAEAYLAQLPRGRILCRLGESAAADRFTESDAAPWATPSARVTGAARALYRRIAERLTAQV